MSAVPEPPARSVILFDGVCNFCSGTVRFVLQRDPHRRFLFASLQSLAGKSLLGRCSLAESPDPTSIVLVEDGRCWTRSTAALRIARRMSGPWPILYAFLIVPRPVRDLVYDIVARNRYRWFGRTESCFVPSPEDRARFLDAGETPVQDGATPDASSG